MHSEYGIYIPAVVMKHHLKSSHLKFHKSEAFVYLKDFYSN